MRSGKSGKPVKKADRTRVRIVPWIAAFLFSALAVAFRFSSEIVERRETIRQRIPAVQAEIAGFSAAVQLPEIDVAIERPLRVLAGSESRLDFTLSAEAPGEIPGLETRLVSETAFAGAEVMDGTAFFPVRSEPFQGNAHVRIRAWPNESRLTGEWTLTALFFDPERTALDSSGAIDRWVRVTKPIEIEAVRFLGLDAAAIRWFFRGWIAAAGLSLIWGLAQLVRRRSVH